VRFDASLSGYGGYLVEHGNLVANGQWSSKEASQSSTWRELGAVRYVLETFQGKLQDKRICWFTDNKNVVRIIQQGSGKPVGAEPAGRLLQPPGRLQVEPCNV